MVDDLSNRQASDVISISSGHAASTVKLASIMNTIDSNQSAQLHYATPSVLASENNSPALLNFPATLAALTAANHAAQNNKTSHHTLCDESHQDQQALANCVQNSQVVPPYNLGINQAAFNTILTQAVSAPQLSNTPSLQGESNIQAAHSVQDQITNILLAQIKCELNKLNKLLLQQKLMRQGCPGIQAVHANNLEGDASRSHVAYPETGQLNSIQEHSQDHLAGSNRCTGGDAKRGGM